MQHHVLIVFVFSAQLALVALIMLVLGRDPAATRVRRALRNAGISVDDAARSMGMEADALRECLRGREMLRPSALMRLPAEFFVVLEQLEGKVRR